MIQRIGGVGCEEPTEKVFLGDFLEITLQKNGENALVKYFFSLFFSETLK